MPRRPFATVGARHWGAAGCSALLVGALLVLWLPSDPDPLAPTPALVDAPPARPAVTTRATPLRIEVAAAAPIVEPAPQPAPLRSFDEIFDDLVGWFHPRAPGDSATAGGAAADRAEQSVAISELVTELLVAFPDAGSRTLQRLAKLETPWPADAAGTGTAHVARVVVDFVLQRLAGEPDLASDLPLLVAEMIDSMPASADMAEFVAQVLAERPFLTGVHEKALIELARQAHGALQFLGDPVRRLLLTVWENLQRTTDKRDAADLLAWFADSDGAALRDAAMQRLLGSDRYRSLIVQHLLEHGTHQDVQNAALYAARQLPSRAALSVLSSLQSGGKRTALIGAYAWMSATRPADMREGYEQCLADNLMPRHREALIVAVGNTASDPGEAVACARAAFDMDPDPRVRGAAFLALCNEGPRQMVTDCLNVAMQDRDFASRYDLGYFVNGVGALARQPDRDVNVIDLATTFLLSQATLKSWDRETLETIRREYLPR